MIGRRPRCRQFEKGLALCFRIAVEQDLFGAAIQSRAADDRMLAVSPMPLVVKKWTVGDRNIGIVFLDPAAHFGDEPLPQIGPRRQHSICIGILRLEQRGDLRRQGRRLAQNLLPVRRLQPGIVILEHDTVDRPAVRTLLDFGRLRLAETAADMIFL